MPEARTSQVRVDRVQFEVRTTEWKLTIMGEKRPELTMIERDKIGDRALSRLLKQRISSDADTP